MSWRNDPISAPAAAPAGSPATPWANDPIAGPTSRQVLTTAVSMKPESVAEAERLAKRYPAPPEVIMQDLEAYRLQEVLDLADTDLQKAPMLREIMRRDVKVAAMAQDDIPTLAKVGKFASDLGGAAKAGVFRASRGAAGTFQAGFEFLAPAFDFLEPVTVVGGNPLRRLAEGFAMQGQAAGQTASIARPKTDGVIEGGFFSGVESLTQNMLALPMAFAPGGQGAALTMMTASTGGDAYQQAREKGLPMSQALPFAASQAAIEYATEKLPLGALLKDVKAGTGFLRILGRQIALEVPGEQIATVLQDLNEWAILNPEKPFSTYLEERPSAAAQTLVATIVGAGGNVAVVKGLETVLSRAVRDGANMQQAGLAAQALQQAMQGAEASRLRERSPEQFRAVMSEMSQDGSLYVDAGVLNQMPPEVLAQLPGVVEALQSATADTPVEVKLADALTILPGTPQAEVFMQNARTAPDAPSLVEAEAAGQKAQEFLQQEAERVIAQAQDQEALRQSQELVKTNIKEQLVATGRFRDAVNEGYATWAAAFYTAYGSRLGMTPEQFYQRYPLRVLGAPVGQQTGVLNAEPRLTIGEIPNTGDYAADTRKYLTEVLPERFKLYRSVWVREGEQPDLNNPGAYWAETPEGASRSGFPPSEAGMRQVLLEVEAGRANIDVDQSVARRRQYGEPEIVLRELPTTAVEVPGVLEQRGAAPSPRARPMPPQIAAAADVGNARTIAASQQWPTNRDFKLAIQNAVRAVMGQRDLREDTPTNRAYITQQLLKEAREALITNSNAIGWYDEKVTTALEVVSTIHPELKTDEQSKFAFIWALAVTSNGIKVDKNFELAERSYRIWKESDADPAKRKLPTSNIGVGPTASKIHEGLRAYNTLIERWGFDRLRSSATTLQPNRDVQAAFGRKVSGEGMDTQVYGAGILGPKIGNGFFMNLYGEFGQLTMDRWWVRMWGRITGDLVEINPAATREARDSFVALIDLIKADRQALRAVEQAIGAKLNKGTPVETAKAIIKATSKEEVRDALDLILPATPEREAAAKEIRGKLKDFVSIGDELRKAAKSYYGYLDGQIEVPGGSKRRDMMREVSQVVLAELQKDNPSLTMADFQALMWYPEKTLYDSAGAQEQDSEGYDDDEAPDYANAAIKLARDQGVSDANINAAVERARSDIASRQLAGRGGRGSEGVPAQGGDGAGADTGASAGTLQQAVLEQGARGTFNPQTLELVLNPNADLSTWFHETGHFFLEVLADVASQPNAPAQITDDYNKVLAWFGVTPEQWAGFSLDEKRPYHERWAESIEQYVMEGKAPSVELQGVMRRFRAWMTSVYQSIKQFLAQRGVAQPGGETLGQGARAQTNTPNFKRWFGDSKVVDGRGRPLVVYHGTNKTDTLADEPGRALRQFDSYVNWFTADPYQASGYATQDGREIEGAATYPVFLSLQKPLRLRGDLNDKTTYAEFRKETGLNVQPGPYEDEVIDGVEQSIPRWWITNSPNFADVAELAGYDGVIAEEGGELTYGVFYPNPGKIKSAIGNSGAFDLKNPDILAQGDQQQPLNIQLNDDIRRVMDRMLATDEQIAQANEVAGFMPDEQADGEAAERLQRRSMADLKWAVKARDKVIAKLKKQAREVEKATREQVTVEVDQMPEMRAKAALDALAVTPEYAGILAEHKTQRQAAETQVRQEITAAALAAEEAKGGELKGLKKGQFLAKMKREIGNQVEARMIEWDRANPRPARPVNATDQDVATIADSFGFDSVDAMLQAIDAFGKRADAIDGLTEQRMLEENGDLIDERAIQEAANEAVHNEARARSLATELRTQREMLGQRTDTGEVNAKGSKITVNALVEAAKQFGANVIARTPLKDLKATAWKHTAAERRAGKRWAEATAKGETAEAVQAKQDQVLNNAAAKAAIDAATEAKKILEFFRRVTKGNDEKTVEKGRDPDIVNAARAVLAAYGIETPTTKGAAAYLEAVKTNDPDTYAAIEPMIAAATANAQPLEALTFEELQGLAESIQAMWFLAKRSRQMEVDGDLLDIDEVADQVYARLETIGIPDRVAGEGMAVTEGEERTLFLQQGIAFLRRVEQWAEGMDGKYGGPFLRYIFQPIKDAADRYRAERITYRKKFQGLVDNLAPIVGDSVIQAPELGYTFGTPGSTAGTAMNEILHAIAHTGNDSNKRKLLLGRGWATENPDGTLDTSRWDAFLRRLVNEGKLEQAHFDFVQGVWDLLEETKPLAQKAHRDAFGRYFSEVTANAFVDPFGVTRRGGYVPAQVDSRQVKDNVLRKLAEEENNSMAYAFPQPAMGFTKGRTEYNKPLMLDLRTLSQHLDKVLLFSHMTNPARDVRKLLMRPKVNQPLNRVQPAAIESMLQPWLQRSAQQIVETPVVGAGKWARIPGIVRSRAGMALMFANVSNAIQQVTGVVGAAVRVKPSILMRAMAQYVSNPVKFSQAVWAASPYMDDRAKNEVAVMNEQMQAILIQPGTFQKAQDFSMRHAYFLQTALDNVLSPIVWTGALNQALADGMSQADAIRFADSTVRQTQGSTLPEDVSRFETGPAYARAFTQFVGYFNMMANTNGTALKQIAGEVGLKKGAGKALYVVMLGFLAPIWIAEAIALAFKGGPEDDEGDGYLDDWLAAVFGMGTTKGLLAQIPILGQFGVAAANRFNDNPLDDRVSLSPAISLLESSVSAPESVYKAIVEDGSAQKAIRDVATLVSVATGVPLYGLARPVGYAAGVAQGKIEPTSAADAARGLVTGTASPESKVR